MEAATLEDFPHRLLGRWQDLTGIQGWLYKEERRLLACLGRDAKVGIVEIGSFKGLSTITMAQPASVHLWSIDPHGPHLDSWPDSYPKLLSNLKRYGVSCKVTALKATSLEAAAQITPEFDLLFIDGDHSYAGTREHADTWATRLTRGGVVAMHDVVNPNFEGPMRVYQELIREGYASAGLVRSTGVLIKP